MAGGGLNRFDRQTGTFKTFLLEPGATSQDNPAWIRNWVLSLYEDRLGALWVGTQGGLYRFDRETESFTAYPHDPADPTTMGPGEVAAIYEDRGSTLWFGAWGLNRFDRVTGTFERFLPDPRFPTKAAAEAEGDVNLVTSIYEDRTGVFWVGTGDFRATHGDGGLNRFDRETGTFTRFQHDQRDPHSLAQNNVTALYEDRQGLLWAGTGGGVDRIDRTARLFGLYRQAPGDPNSLQGGLIQALHLDRTGRLWAGTSYGVLSRIDRQTGTISHYRPDADDPTSISREVIGSIYEDRQGYIWVGFFRGKLERLDPRTGRFRKYRHHPDDPTALNNSGVMTVIEDRAGTLWVNGQKLHRYNPETDNFTRFDLETSWFLNILEDREGMLWFGTCGGDPGIRSSKV